MELEQNPPQTLVEILNNHTHIELFQDWFKAHGTAFSTEMVTTSLRYDSQRSELVFGRGHKDTQVAVNSYLSKDPIGIDPESCSWAIVLDKMYRAKKEWEGKGRFRLRGGGRIERVILPVLEAIPTDNGLGLLKSALTVIFHAVKRRSDACERILNCFSEIPEMIAKGHTLARIHSGKPEVENRVKGLYHALFDSIPSLIGILLRQNTDQRKSWKRATDKVAGVVKDLVGDPVKEVEDLIAPITAAVSSLEDCATMLNNERVEMIYKRVAGLEVNIQLILDIIRPKNAEISRLYNKVDELISAQQDRREFLTLANALFRLFAETKRKRDLEARPLAPENGANRTAQLLDHRRREFPSARRQSRKPQRAIERLYNVDMNSLLEVIGTDDEHLVSHRDRDRLVRMQSEFSTKALRNAYHIMESDEMKTWMSSPEAELMMVDGDCLSQMKGRASPMTMLCASVAAGLTTNTASPDPGMEPAGAAVLFFACGDHSSPPSLLPGPVGMVRSLISQLLIARDLPWNPRQDSKGRVSYGRHPDLSFLEASSTLWPEILQHGNTGTGSHSISGVLKQFQTLSLIQDKKQRRSDLSTINSNSNSDSDSDYDYTTGNYKPTPQCQPQPQPKPPNPIAEQTYLNTLLDLFIKLIQQLDHHTTVFCIIDGASYYEPAHCGWQPQITGVIRRLADELLCSGRDGKSGQARKVPTFKLLMTSPSRSSALFSLVKSSYLDCGALCVSMATRRSPYKTRGEYLGIQTLNVPAAAAGPRPRSTSGRRDGYYGDRGGGGGDLRDEERHYSDSGGGYYGDRRRRGEGYPPMRRMYRL